MWKKVAMAYFKVLFQDLPGESQGNHKNCQSG